MAEHIKINTNFISAGINEQHKVVQEILDSALFIRTYIEEKDYMNEFNPKITKIRFLKRL